MPKDVMRAKVKEIEKQQAEIRRELDGLRDQTQRLDELEELEDMTAMYTVGPNGIHLVWFEDEPDGPYSYRNLLKKLRLRITKHEDGKLEVAGHWLLPNVAYAKVDLATTKGG